MTMDVPEVVTYSMPGPFGRETYHYVRCITCHGRTQDQDSKDRAAELASEHRHGEGEWPPWHYPAPAPRNTSASGWTASSSGV